MDKLGADTISIPVSALFCRPFIQTFAGMGRLIWNGRDITPDADHFANRRACQMANEQNAETAKRFGVTPPYYHYDALSGKALRIAHDP